MNPKEISEIKKTFSKNNSSILRICGCYVNEQKEKVTEFKDAFLALPEEEMNKYFSIFKKTLSGSVGKNLVNMDFPQEEELSTESSHAMLMKLLDCELKDEALLSSFYDKVIENYDTVEHYLILLVHQIYDVPGRTADGIEMLDASTTMYGHILCSICPVSLTKAGLSYSPEDNSFKNRIRDWVVDMPDVGFLFPAFNDRASDVHSLLYYSAKPEALKLDLSGPLLGCNPSISAKDQKAYFNSALEETLGNCDFEVVKNMHDIINEKISEAKMAELPDPVDFSDEDVKQILSDSGVENKKLEEFGDALIGRCGTRNRLLASNIVDTRKFEVKTPSVVVKVKADRTDLVETKIIDGIPYILIKATEDVEVNGLPVSIQGYVPPAPGEDDEPGTEDGTETGDFY